jgi:DNA-binding CsgD family transcriptional regulator
MARGSGAAAPSDEPHEQGERTPLRRVDGPRVWVDGGTSRGRKRTARLSRKERSVLHELARGFSTDQIAAELVVSPHTVRTHIKNGMRKLEAKTRAHAVAIALSEGAIEFDPRD